jgi:TonB family protein
VRRLVCAAAALAALALRAPADPVPACNTLGNTAPKPANQHTAQDYPMLSVMMGEQGTTTVSIVVGEDGTAKSASVETSSGSLRLDDASIAAIVGKWRYTPPLAADNKPTACVQRAEVKWVLHDNANALPPELQQMAIRMKPEDYPSGARSRNEQGIVALFVLRDEHGKQAIVLRSSGYPELDEAAVRIMKERLNLPAAEYEGKAVDTSALVLVVWSLEAAQK